jgi:hypothetical protein
MTGPLHGIKVLDVATSPGEHTDEVRSEPLRGRHA